MTIQTLEKYTLGLLLSTISFISTKNLFNFPLNLYPYKLFGLILIILFLINLKNNLQYFPKKPLIIYLFICLILFTTASYFYAFNFESSIKVNITSRYTIQMISLLTQFSIGFYLYKFILKDYKFVRKYMFVGFYIALFIALIHFLGISTGLFNWGGGILDNFQGNRVIGFSGEPKMLAAYIAPFVLYFIYTKFKKGVIIGILSVVLFFKTYSTSAFISIFIGFVLIIVKEKKISIVKLTIIIMTILLISTNETLHHQTIGRITSLLAPSTIKDPLKTVVHFPIIDKDIAVDGNEASSFELLFDNPWVAITGIGYGMESVYAYLYLNVDTAGFLGHGYSGNITPNNAMLRNILYFGIFFFIYIFLYIMRTGFRLLGKSKNNELKFFGVFLLVCGISNILIFSNNFSVIPLLFIAIGMNRIMVINRKDTL